MLIQPIMAIAASFSPVRLIPTAGLTDQLREATRRFVSGHESDLRGLLERWEDLRPACHDYIVVDNQRGQPIGLVSWTGPPYRAVPSYWLHCDFRGQGLGSEAIDALAVEMKTQGVTGIADEVVIQTPGGNYDEQSKALIRRLRSHFQRSY